MTSDSGFGSSGSPFEYTVAEAKSKSLAMKKMAFIALYIVWALAIFISGFILKLTVYLIAIVPLTTYILVLCTWRFTQLEYEYSFFVGKMTISKIYGNRTRKKMIEIHIQDLSAAFPYTDENVARADAFQAENVIFAASSYDAPNLYILLWQDKDTGKRCMLCFEAIEKAIKIMKYYNASAFAK